MTAANTMSIFNGANRLDARWTLALRKWGAYAVAVIVQFKALAPYALIELVLGVAEPEYLIRGTDW